MEFTIILFLSCRFLDFPKVLKIHSYIKYNDLYIFGSTTPWCFGEKETSGLLLKLIICKAFQRWNSVFAKPAVMVFQDQMEWLAVLKLSLRGYCLGPQSFFIFKRIKGMRELWIYMQEHGGYEETEWSSMFKERKNNCLLDDLHHIKSYWTTLWKTVEQFGYILR